MTLSTAASWAQLASVVPLFLAPVVFWRHNNCDTRRCPLIARHPVQATAFKVCRRHHRRDCHESLQRRHEREHPDRLTFADAPPAPSTLGLR